MGRTILLYGATGFSGALIASELQQQIAEAGSSDIVLLAGRDANRLKALGIKLDMDHRVFSLDARKDVRRGLNNVDVVLNAAGPFAWTAERLAKVALEIGSHYLDINGEADVYLKLDDLDFQARQLGVALVCGAGFWAAASDVMLDCALTRIALATPALKKDLGAIRIAASRITTFSRGSVDTVWRSLREQAIVVRRGMVDAGSKRRKPGMVVWHEPVGKIERTFDFGPAGDHSDPSRLRIASVASLVDTLVARRTVLRRKYLADTVESYVECGPISRLGYQVGAFFAPIVAMPRIRTVLAQSVKLLPEGPTEQERKVERHVVLLEIEDRFRRKILDWRWETPNVYQFTAQLVTGATMALGTPKLAGWRTPAEILKPRETALTTDKGPFRGCVLEDRLGG